MDEVKDVMRTWVGKQVFIRTVTYFYVGELVSADMFSLVLKKAAWIPDTGRFNEAMATGKFDVVEPYPETKLVLVSRGGIIDMNEYDFPLPLKTK